MRYVTVPPAAVIESVTQKDGEHPSITFEKFIREVLVTHAKVTETDDSIGKFMDLAEKAKGAEVGSTLALTDEEHEFLSTLARTFQFSAESKLYVLPLLKAITSAPSKASVALASVAEAG